MAKLLALDWRQLRLCPDLRTLFRESIPEEVTSDLHLCSELCSVLGLCLRHSSDVTKARGVNTGSSPGISLRQVHQEVNNPLC